jgi:hypothetical protein
MSFFFQKVFAFGTARIPEQKIFGQTRIELKKLLFLSISWFSLCVAFGIVGSLLWQMSWQGWVCLYVMLAAIFMLIADKWEAFSNMPPITLTSNQVY